VVLTFSLFLFLRNNETSIFSKFDDPLFELNTEKWSELKEYLNLTFATKARRISKRNHLRFCNYIAQGFLSEGSIKDSAREIFNALDRFSQLAVIGILAEKDQYLTAMNFESLHETDLRALKLALELIETRLKGVRLPYEHLSVISRIGYFRTLKKLFRIIEQFILINYELKSATTHSDLTDILKRIQMHDGRKEGLDPSLFHHFEAAFTEVTKRIGPLNKILQHEIRQQFEITTYTLMELLLPFWRAIGEVEHNERFIRLFLAYSQNPHWLQVIESNAARLGYFEQELRELLGHRLDETLHSSTIGIRNRTTERQARDLTFITEAIDSISLDISRAL
jgi:hypothetical protein